MKCNHCGIELPDGVNMCVYCGAKIDLEAGTEIKQENSTMCYCPYCCQDVTPQAEPLFSITDIIIGVLLLTFGFVIIGLIYFGIKYYIKRGLPKKSICPICKKELPYNYSGNFENPQLFDTAKKIVKNKDFQNSVKDLKDAAKDFSNSLDINK